MKLSVIIPYGYKEEQPHIDELNQLIEYSKHNKIVNQEFQSILNRQSPEHILDITLDCLEHQTFKDFEVIISTKYPTNLDIKKFDLDIKVVRDKETYFKDRFALNNARNTGIIHSKGELLFFLDTMNVFNNYLLEEIINNFYNLNTYTTCNAIRRIKHNPNKIQLRLWRSKYRANGVGFSYKNNIFHTLYLFKDKIVPHRFTWGYGFSVSYNDTIYLNGFDEIYDGAKGLDDVEFGVRLERLSKRQRVISDNLLYEILTGESHGETFTENEPRDNRILLWYWTMKKEWLIKANKTKPDKEFLDMYPDRYYHLNKKHPPDGWDDFMNVETFDINDLIGKVKNDK